MVASLVRVIGDSPRAKIWQFLLIGRDFEYHIKDISEGSKVSRPTCYKELRQLLHEGYLTKGNKYRGKQLYKLNKDTSAVRTLMRFFDKLLYSD